MTEPTHVHLMHIGIGRSVDFCVDFGTFYEMHERFMAMSYTETQRHYLKSGDGRTWRYRDLTGERLRA